MGETTGARLLRRARAVLADTRCQATGCYAVAGHRPDCVRGRAEKVVAEIDEHLRERMPARLGL